LLKATTAIVPLYNRSVDLAGIPYVDGGISNPIPIESALSAGCTHVLVLLTRPPEFELTPASGLQRHLISLMLRGWESAFVEKYFSERIRRYGRARDLAFGRTQSGASIAVIGPLADSPPLTRMTVSPHRLQMALQDAIERTRSIFEFDSQASIS
jgi:predicted patatin/cPLA2 family phospholipase